MAMLSKKAKRDLPKLWQGFDDIQKDLLLYLVCLPAPVSIDALVALSGGSVIAVLNAMDKLRSRKVVTEEKGRGKGFYRFNGDDGTEFVRGYATPHEAGRVTARLLETSDEAKGSSSGDSETLNVADLLVKAEPTDRSLAVVKRAADLLARSGQNERAARHYDYCLRSMSDRGITSANAEDFLDCVIGRVSLLIYHMSAQDELTLLDNARDVAVRYKTRDRLARIDVLTAQILQTLGEHEKAFRYFNDFLKLAGKVDDPKLVKSAILTACEFLFWKGRFSEVVGHYERIVGSLEEFGDDEASLKAASLVGCCFVFYGRIGRGIGLIETVRAKGALLGLQPVTIFADAMMTLSLFEIRRTIDAEPYLNRLFEVSEEVLGHLISRGINDERAYILCTKGEFQKAFEYHQRGVRHAASLGWRHHPGPWTFEYLDVLESKGFIDDEVNYDSEVSRLVGWDDLRMKGAAYRYRALRNLERNRALGTVLPDLRESEKYLRQAGAEVELARTRIALGRYFLKKDAKAVRSYLEKAWAVLSRIDKDLFPRDLLETMPEERKLEVMVERMIQINESLGTMQDQAAFLEKMIEVAMDFVMATRGNFIIIGHEGESRQVVSRNIDPLLFETEQSRMVRTLVVDAAMKGVELIFPAQPDDATLLCGDGEEVYERAFRQAGIHSFIGMPVQLGGRTYGYLCLDNRLGGEPFSWNQIPLVRFLCSQTGVGLSNLDTYKEMRDLKDHFEAEAIFYKKEMGIAAPIELVGSKSEAMKRVIDRIRQVAPTDSSVLILGETGVGKELVAKSVHNLSDRKGGPFIPVNIAAIPAELVASELFGHEKGAFTGAHERHKGRFELANGGTIFLDEIGDLPPSVQVKLLRVLQEGTFERVGSSQPIRSDFRVVAATNKNLAAEVEKGSFRQDLYYRLDVFPIHVPPLRERREDIPELVRYFVDKFCKKFGRRVTRIPREEMNKLIEHTWPGNVRELEHRIEQALILSDGNTISFPDPVQSHGDNAAQQLLDADVMTLENMERAYIERILNMTRWRVMGHGGAAAVLGMKPTTLFSRMKKLGIKRMVGSA
jgi:transcriptional regulator with GAF, ATPase, and Fis domain/tetratricopeptide (TPR) repeat protein